MMVYFLDTSLLIQNLLLSKTAGSLVLQRPPSFLVVQSAQPLTWINFFPFLEENEGEVMKVSSIFRSVIIYGLSLLAVCSAPRGFLRVLRFPLSSKISI